MFNKNKLFLKRFAGLVLALVLAITGAAPLQVFAGEVEDAARAYLVENYINNNKVITTGGDGVVKSADGLTYTIGTKTSSGASISSIRLKMEGSSSNYKTGWYISKDNPYIFYKAPSLNTSRSITGRPETDYSFTATLKLFAAGTESSAIDDGTAEALATQDFTFILKAEPPKPQVTFNPVDSVTKETISGAKVTVEYNWSTLTANSDGSYTLETDKTYTVTASADGYNKYSNSAYVPDAAGGKVELPMAKIQKSTIAFAVKDSLGNMIPDATIQVKQGYYTIVSPQADGTYSLNNGTSYSYTVSAANYSGVTGTITPSGDETIAITMSKNINTYKVIFDIKDTDGNTVNDSIIQVTDENDEEVSPNSDGSYSMSKLNEYSYSISAEGYKTADGAITPSGDEETITKTIKLEKNQPVDAEDLEKVNAVKAKFNSELGALRPNYATDKNICELVLSKIRGYSDIDTEGVTVELKTTEDTNYIEENGDIDYVSGDLNQFGNNSKNVRCSFVFKYNGAEATTDNRVVTVCWDRDYYNGKINNEADSLSWDTIKSGNTDISAVETDLTLPQIMTNSARTAWSNIKWTSSNPDVIAIESTGYDSLVDPKKGKVTPADKDTDVVLTAEFTANDSALNSYVEKVSDFATVTKTFKVTVKGTGTSLPTAESLQELLDKYYTAADLKDFVSQEILNTNAVEGDIQLPRYTRITDESGQPVFNNKEIEVTSSNTDILTINGYRANVDVFAGKNETESVDLIITFTRDGISVSKTIPLKVKMITDAMLEEELKLMEIAKANYFAGINDGKYLNSQSITGNLHPFKEMTLDEQGKPAWAYDTASVTGTGIIADGYFDDPWAMEAAGYNLFKSSNNNVIKHENLLVTRPESATDVTITSWLSSSRYGKYAVNHPDNEKLQKLYKQEVSVTVTVLKQGDTASELPPQDDQEGDDSNNDNDNNNDNEYVDDSSAGEDSVIETSDASGSEKAKDSAPSTGDNAPIGLAAMLMLIAALLLIGITAHHKKRVHHTDC
ncbi:MAG: hypothetical protein Q4C17_07365 [Bacillota bacterium]|nr:hypothetical protein [Bacillota bacterium]